MAKLVIELTDRCNLRCGHCPSGRHGGHGELGFGILKRVLGEAAGCGIDLVSFTGGEPTLHSRFPEVVAETAAAGLRFSMVSNGWSFPKHLDALLAHRQRLGTITFSLDGARQATHDALRGRGSFRRILQAASACVLRGLPFGFNVVLTRANRGEAADAVALAAGLGAVGVRFGHLMSDPHPSAIGLELSHTERKALDVELKAIRAASLLPVSFAPGGWSEKLFPCEPLRGREYNLDWRGRLGLCCHLSGFAGEERAIAADLSAVGLAEGLAVLEQLRDGLKDEKQRCAARGDWRDDDHFSCWYCAKRFGAVDWIRERPDHPWHVALVGGCSSMGSTEATSNSAMAVGTEVQPMPTSPSG